MQSQRRQNRYNKSDVNSVSLLQEMFPDSKVEYKNIRKPNQTLTSIVSKKSGQRPSNTNSSILTPPKPKVPKSQPLSRYEILSNDSPGRPSINAFTMPEEVVKPREAVTSLPNGNLTKQLKSSAILDQPVPRSRSKSLVDQTLPTRPVSWNNNLPYDAPQRGMAATTPVNEKLNLPNLERFMINPRQELKPAQLSNVRDRTPEFQRFMKDEDAQDDITKSQLNFVSIEPLHTKSTQLKKNTIVNQAPVIKPSGVPGQFNKDSVSQIHSDEDHSDTFLSDFKAVRANKTPKQDTNIENVHLISRKSPNNKVRMIDTRKTGKGFETEYFTAIFVRESHKTRTRNCKVQTVQKNRRFSTQNLSNIYIKPILREDNYQHDGANSKTGSKASSTPKVPNVPQERFKLAESKTVFDIKGMGTILTSKSKNAPEKPLEDQMVFTLNHPKKVEPPIDKSPRREIDRSQSIIKSNERKVPKDNTIQPFTSVFTLKNKTPNPKEVKRVVDPQKSQIFKSVIIQTSDVVSTKDPADVDSIVLKDFTTIPRKSLLEKSKAAIPKFDSKPGKDKKPGEALKKSVTPLKKSQTLEESRQPKPPREQPSKSQTPEDKTKKDKPEKNKNPEAKQGPKVANDHLKNGPKPDVGAEPTPFKDELKKGQKPEENVNSKPPKNESQKVQPTNKIVDPKPLKNPLKDSQKPHESPKKPGPANPQYKPIIPNLSKSSSNPFKPDKNNKDLSQHSDPIQKAFSEPSYTEPHKNRKQFQNTNRDSLDEGDPLILTPEPATKTKTPEPANNEPNLENFALVDTNYFQNQEKGDKKPEDSQIQLSEIDYKNASTKWNEFADFDDRKKY